MDTLILTLTFVAAVMVAGCLVLVFSGPIDDILCCFIPEEMTQGWSRYVKFAIFAASFGGGMRLSELAAFVAQRQAPIDQPPISVSQGLLEIYKTVAGSLGAASGTLLIFFVSTLAVYAASRVYASFKPAPSHPRGGTDRHSVGAERL